MATLGVDDEYYNDMWMLDTHTWTWIKPSVSGIQPIARTGGVAALLSSKYLIFGLGIFDWMLVYDVLLFCFANPF